MSLNRSLIVGLCILNVSALGLSEIQRRALVSHTAQMENALFVKIDAYETAQNKFAKKIEEYSIVLATRSDQLLALNGAIASNGSSKNSEALRGVRVEILKNALIRYRDDNKQFPQISTKPISNLAPFLVRKYLDAIPEDPAGNDIFYATDEGGTRFGLKVTLDDSSECVSGYGYTHGWWGNLKKCPF